MKNCKYLILISIVSVMCTHKHSDRGIASQEVVRENCKMVYEPMKSLSDHYKFKFIGPNMKFKAIGKGEPLSLHTEYIGDVYCRLSVVKKTHPTIYLDFDASKTTFEVVEFYGSNIAVLKSNSGKIYWYECWKDRSPVAVHAALQGKTKSKLFEMTYTPPAKFEQCDEVPVHPATFEKPAGNAESPEEI